MYTLLFIYRDVRDPANVIQSYGLYRKPATKKALWALGDKTCPPCFECIAYVELKRK